jgi:hypothetical protein
MAIAQMIFPLKANKQIRPKLVDKFTILAFAEACKNQNHINAMNATTKAPCARANETVIKSNNYANHHGMSICFVSEISLATCCPNFFLGMGIN